ncbi:MAG: hypothetical protein HY922_09795 [Elusimicrobia bacterium]|nr:hypothetical protein [Elusimicrobiota bacterium]
MKTFTFSSALLILSALAAAAPPGPPDAENAAAEPAASPSAPKAPSQAQDQTPAGQLAYAAIEEPLGAEGIQILADRSVLVLSASKKTHAILYARWPALEALSARADDLAALVKAYEKARAGQPIDGDPAALRRVEEMKEVGPVTAAVRASAALLAAHIESLAAPAGAPPSDAGQKPLPAFAWGREFWNKVHADLLADFQPVAGLFFEEFFMAQRKNAQAEAHFLSFEKDAERLERDRGARKASRQTLDSIASYLAEQKRLWNLSLTKERLEKLEKASDLRKDLKDLSVLAPRMASGPDLLRALRFSFDSKTPEPAVRFSGADLHIHPTAGAEPFDVGDEAVVSLAYWIDGASAKDAFEITEAAFLDEGEGEPGISEVKISLARRAAGGPHVVKLPLPLRSSGRKTHHFLLSTAEGALARREISFEVSPELDQTRSAAAQAEAAAQACRLAESEQAFSELESKLQSSADKPQFKAVLAWLKPRVKRASEQAAQLKTVMELLDGVRLHASKEQCDFKSEKARRALALLDGLPPGCDRLSASSERLRPLRAEIENLLRLSESRRANQDAFRAAAEKGRRQEAACRYDEAAEAYSCALALLDSDKEARCGAWEDEFTAIHLQNLPRARAAKALSDEFAAVAEKAEQLASGDPKDYAGALQLLNPLIARIDSLDSRACYQSMRSKAEKLAGSAGIGLSPSLPASVMRESLPKDDVNEAVKAVSAERNRLERSETERIERESKRQEPSIRSIQEALPDEQVPGGRP